MGVDVGDLPDVAQLPALSTPNPANATTPSFTFMPGGNGNGNGGEASDAAWG